MSLGCRRLHSHPASFRSRSHEDRSNSERQNPVSYARKEYENRATTFGRHSDNEGLIKRLRPALKDRSYIAHNAIGHYHREKNPETAQNILEKLQKIEDDGYDLVEELNKELRKLRMS
jgi:uncharacterized protein YdiU (UPF0061 family)